MAYVGVEPTLSEPSRLPILKGRKTYEKLVDCQFILAKASAGIEPAPESILA